MDFSTILLIGILALDFVFSVWNAYAAGFNLAILRRNTSGALWLTATIASVAALALAFAGATYVLAITLGFVAMSMGYIGAGVLTSLLAWNFLVFGGMITMFGIVVTVENLVIAIKTRNKFGLVISAWNIFASIWNVITYIRNFGMVKSMLKADENEKNAQGKLIILFAIAIALAIIIVYAAYHMGSKKGSGQTGKKSDYYEGDQ